MQISGYFHATEALMPGKKAGIHWRMGWTMRWSGIFGEKKIPRATGIRNQERPNQSLVAVLTALLRLP